MTKLKWDEIGKRLYETGCDRGVLYLQANDGTYPNGVAWNGLTGIDEAPSGADKTDLWADNLKYLSLRAAEDFGYTIKAYTYPDEFEQCDGSASPVEGMTVYQQVRKTFGMSYRTLIGNDVKNTDYGYKIHLVYGSTVSPSSRSYATVNDSPEAIEFSWEASTIAVPITVVEGFKATAEVTIDSTKCPDDKLKALEAILYGDDGTATYTEFSGSTFADNTDYYTRSGTEGHYVYTKTSASEPEQGTTYYTKSVSGDSTSRLPLPDEIITLLGTGA